MADSRFGLRDIVVDFGPTRAVDHVSFDIGPGEIVGLLGHNGAGKSTIVNIASGALKWTSGSVEIDGEPQPRGASPGQMAGAGVTVIHQEPSLIAGLTVLDNLLLGARLPAKTSRSGKEKLAREALERIGVRVNLAVPVGTLSLGERQMVDLARGSLAGDTKVLLLDEPTAALGLAETEQLHGLIREYAAGGVAVVYVSHRLPDILDVCTRVLVLRSGALVLDRSTEDLSLAELSEALVPGVHKVALDHPERVTTFVQVEGPGWRIEAGKREVVGLFGMAAGEQFAIAASLFGLADAGAKAWLRGLAYKPSGPREAMKNHVAYVPPDRDIDGLVPGFSGKDNVMLPWNKPLGGAWYLPSDFQQEVYDDAWRQLNVMGPGGTTPISQYSGGNRQKQLLSRWMFPTPCDLLVMAQPTQGVDVGARADIVRVIRQVAADKTCVLVASSETDEITSMCDRAYVILGGRAKLLAGDDLTDKNLLDALLELAELGKRKAA